jgi:hypothetical protein
MADPLLSKEQQDDLMRGVAKGLDDVFNPGWNRGRKRTVGFALLTYNFGEHLEGTGLINYIGNGSRDDVLIALKELVARWEGRRPAAATGGKPS